MEFQTKIKSTRNTLIPVTICIPDNLEEFSLVLLAHGFCSNRDEDGAYYSLARRLMDAGIASIRIDFPGCNESKESHLFNTIDNDVLDLKTAHDYMLNNYQITSVGIVGYSLGAKVATHYVDKYHDVNTIVVFAPAISNGLNWHSSITLGKQEVMEEALDIAKDKGHYDYLNEFDGRIIPLSYEFIEQCLTYKTLDKFSEIKIPALMIYGDNDDLIPLDIYNEVISNSHNSKFESHLIKGTNHGFGMWDNKPEQFEELVSTAFKFIIKNID